MTPNYSRNGRVYVRAETETLASLDLNWIFSLTHVWTVHKRTSKAKLLRIGGNRAKLKLECGVVQGVIRIRGQGLAARLDIGTVPILSKFRGHMALLTGVHDSFSSSAHVSSSTIIPFQCTVPTTVVATTTDKTLPDPSNPPTSLVVAIQVAPTTRMHSCCSGSTQLIRIGLGRLAWPSFKLHW